MHSFLDPQRARSKRQSSVQMKRRSIPQPLAAPPENDERHTNASTKFPHPTPGERQHRAEEGAEDDAGGDGRGPVNVEDVDEVVFRRQDGQQHAEADHGGAGQRHYPVSAGRQAPAVEEQSAWQDGGAEDRVRETVFRFQDAAFASLFPPDVAVGGETIERHTDDVSYGWGG